MKISCKRAVCESVQHSVKPEPDYTVECEVCGQVPTVKLGKDNLGLCGVCCFGSAACLDPAEW